MQNQKSLTEKWKTSQEEWDTSKNKRCATQKKHKITILKTFDEIAHVC